MICPYAKLYVQEMLVDENGNRRYNRVETSAPCIGESCGYYNVFTDEKQVIEVCKKILGETRGNVDYA